MRKRILNGRLLWIVKDSEYLKYVPQAREDYEDNDESSQNPQCHGCVDRYASNECPTFYNLGLERNADGVCTNRVLDEIGMADFIAKRMGVT